MKTLYFIRHGTALHNLLFWDIGDKAYTTYRDTPLVQKGFEEAYELGKTWEELKNIELVLVSPLTRTLQTQTNIFGENRTATLKHILALDCLVEHPLGANEICNRRKDKSMLKINFPWVNFDLIKDEKFKWGKIVEKEDELGERLEELKKFIRSRNEKKIAIVAHSCVINKYLHNHIGDETNDLDNCKHCFPYKVDFE
jgi:broad specificity phosphatase PhoE